MRLLCSLLPFLPLINAIQTIYLGTVLAFDQQGTYIAWFSDSDPCSKGTKMGNLTLGFTGCDEPFTLIDHTNITFTGCNTGMHVTSNPTPPVGVSDNGVPALKCVGAEYATNAPWYNDGRDLVCKGCDNGGIVSVIGYCS